MPMGSMGPWGIRYPAPYYVRRLPVTPAIEEINETDGEAETEDGRNTKDRKTATEHETELVKERP